MDLPQVKATVKAWEKSFKAKNKREPTKDDIKKDQGGIAEQYALYRKLSKLSSSSSQPSSASTSTSTWQSAGTRVTPRTIPTSDYPTTPTPPARRTTFPSRQSNAEAGPSNGQGNLKRTASIADLQPSSPIAPTSTALNTFLTPRKPRPKSPPAYTGPVHDPNPHNPFLASPSKARLTPLPPADTATSSSQSRILGRTEYDASSPFIHASSPRKLKEVLEANSLRKVRARKLEDDSPQKGKGVTPRTRARKRLRGEAVEDTPGKPKVERRKRGHRDDTVLKDPGMEVMPEAEEEDEEEEGMEEEDEFGQTPMKPSNGVRSFTSLLDEAAASAANHSAFTSDPKGGPGSEMTVKAKGRAANRVGSSRITQAQMNSFFGRSSKSKPLQQNDDRPDEDKKPDVVILSTVPPQSEDDHREGKEIRPEPKSSPSAHTELYTSQTPLNFSEPIERLPTPPPDPEIELAASSQISAPRSAARRRVLRVMPSDEEAEISQSGNGGRELVIVPTRRTAKTRRRSDSFDLDDDPDHTPGAEEAEQEDQEEDGNHPELDILDPAKTPTPPSSPSIPPHLLSLLSLRSPTQPRTKTKRSDLVVRSLFDPDAARRLRAIQRGQDVHLGGEDRAGEEEEQGEEEVLERYKAKVGFGADAGRRQEDEDEDVPEEGGEGGYGDDDWEEEDEGWKRTGEDMEDW